MFDTIANPLILLILALLLLQSLVYLISGRRQLRQRQLSKRAAGQTRQELGAWGILVATQHGTAPAVGDLLLFWRILHARSRIGRGAGILFALPVTLAALDAISASGFLGGAVPPLFLAIILLVQGCSLGMFFGSAAGLFVGVRRKKRAPAQESSPEDAPRRVGNYRLRSVALLPGALLLGDVLLVGALDLLSLPTLPPAEVWSLALLPALVLLTCIAGEIISRRIISLPALYTSDDMALATRADSKLRAHCIGMMLELEVFGLFILVVSQWLLRTLVVPHTSSIFYNGPLLVYGVVILSLRGLLDRAQQQAGVGT